MRDRENTNGSGVVRAIAFDLDGVLVDSEAVNVRSAFETFREFGCPLDEDATGTIVGRHPVDYVPVLSRKFGLDADRQSELCRRQSEMYRSLWNETVQAMPGVPDVPRRLRAGGMPLSMATSAGRSHAERCLDRFELRPLFDFVLTKDDVSRRKPDPEVYARTATRFGLEPERVLAVEDSEHGVLAAKAAGVRCIAVRTPHVDPERLRAADAIVHSLLDLEAAVASLGDER